MSDDPVLKNVDSITLTKLVANVSKRLYEVGLDGPASSCRVSIEDRVESESAVLVTMMCKYLATLPDVQQLFEFVPADWWQHLKQRWLPRRLRLRFGIRMREIEINRVTHGRMCPHIAIPASRDTESIHFDFLTRGCPVEPAAELPLIKSLERLYAETCLTSVREVIQLLKRR